MKKAAAARAQLLELHAKVMGRQVDMDKIQEELDRILTLSDDVPRRSRSTVDNGMPAVEI